MTQAEKAKAYDEALEDIRAIYPNLKGDAKLAVEHAFPELAESENEKTRKQLLDFLEHLYASGKDTAFDNWSKADCANWIAYIEKQKEQKPGEWSEEEKDKVVRYLHDRDGGMLWSKATEITRDILDMLRPYCKPSEEQKRK